LSAIERVDGPPRIRMVPIGSSSVDGYKAKSEPHLPPRVRGGLPLNEFMATLPLFSKKRGVPQWQ
jgi:hypothetical protein